VLVDLETFGAIMAAHIGSPAELAPTPPHVPADLVVDYDLFADADDGDAFAPLIKMQRSIRADAVWTPHNGGHWILLRGSRIHEAFADYKHFSSRLVLLPRVRAEAFPSIPLSMDPPESSRYRALFSRPLAPSAVKDMEPVIRSTAIELIERFCADRRCEFIQSYATPLPIHLFMRLCGLPLEDAPLLRYLGDQIPRPDGTMTPAEAMDRAAAYLAPHLEERRRHPGDDLLSHLYNGKVQGRPLTPDEAMKLCTTALFGGVDTVVALFSQAFLYLARNPDQQRRLVEKPSLIPVAVEEFVRRFGVVAVARVMAADYDVTGAQLKKDDMVLLPTMLHGLDEREYADPLKIDFDRPLGPNSTFGNGAHKCPGRMLGIAEFRITLEEWLARIPSFELEPGTVIEMIPSQTFQLKRLSLRWPASRSNGDLV
jgi:camphor 5-monooxygenase